MVYSRLVCRHKLTIFNLQTQIDIHLKTRLLLVKVITCALNAVGFKLLKTVVALLALLKNNYNDLQGSGNVVTFHFGIVLISMLGQWRMHALLLLFFCLSKL